MAPTKAIDETLTQNTSTSTSTWDVGRGVFAAYGTFDGGTAELQVSYDDGTTWIGATSDLAIGNNAISLTSNGAIGFFVPTGADVRVNLSNATSPDLEVEVMEMTESSISI